MNKTTRIILVAAACAATAYAIYRFIPELRKLAANLRQLQLIMEDVEDTDEDGEMYRVGSVNITDPEVLRRIDEALKDHPDGWVKGERPVRHPDPEPVAE